MSAKVNSSIVLYQGKVFKLVKENITLLNGVTINFDIIRHPGAAAIVPLFGNNTALLIKQYRHALGDFIWEIPAGTLNQNETPLECAKRELIEETGFTADVWKELGEITPVPGYSDECIHIFMATNLAPAKQKLDKDEILNVHKMKLDYAMEMIYKGEIRDGKTISALCMVAHWLQDQRGVWN
jgi:ADP-ribose pyrophosphatase